ncbi:MAG: hypothetical protein R3A12_16725 [Ignavibacteria bacterium]
MGTTGDSVKCIWRVIGYNGIDSIPSANTFLITLVRTNVGIRIIVKCTRRIQSRKQLSESVQS